MRAHRRRKEFLVLKQLKISSSDHLFSKELISCDCKFVNGGLNAFVGHHPQKVYTAYHKVVSIQAKIMIENKTCKSWEVVILCQVNYIIISKIS